MARRIAVAALIFVIPTIGSPHHAAAGLYDREAVGVVEGEVVSIFWRNPHVRFTLERPGEGGETETWEIEGGSVNTLERVGIYSDTVEVGDTVSFWGFPGREGRRVIFARELTLADGQLVPMAVQLSDRYVAAAETSRREAEGIFRVWVPTQTMSIGQGRISFPLTEKAREAKEAWDPTEDTALQCIPQGMPGAMDNPYPIEFVDEGDRIMLYLEEWDGVRTIHMDAVSDPEPSPMGYSIGRWEGTTLVVETTNITFPYFDDLGTPLSREAVVTERFAQHPNGRVLTWDGEILDSENFTEPVSMHVEWQYLPGQEVKPFNCTLTED